MSEQGSLPPHWVDILLANISDSVIVTDKEGIIRFWNDGARRTYKYAAGEALGTHINILHVPTEGEELQEALLLAQEGEVVTDVEVVLKSRDGKMLTVLLSIVPILGDLGEVAYLAAIGKDITVVRDLEQKVLAAEKLETVREVIITLNHNMNQPLAVAGLYLGMIRDESINLPPEEQEEYLRLIEEQLDRVAGLLRKVADMEEVRTVKYLAEDRMFEIEGPEEDGTVAFGDTSSSG